MSLDACAALVEKADPLRFRAAMCAPMPLRGDLMALYAFNVEVSRAPWASAESMICQMRLQWWSDAVEEIFDGTPRRHEVVGPLAEAIHRHRLERSDLEALIKARHRDLSRAQEDDVDAFGDYIDATSAGLMVMAAQVLGGQAGCLDVARLYGWGCGIAALWEGARALYARGYAPVPSVPNGQEVLLKASRGEVAFELAAKVEEVTALARNRIREARMRSGEVERAQHPAFLAGFGADAVLAFVQRSPDQILSLPPRPRAPLRFLIAQTLGRW